MDQSDVASDSEELFNDIPQKHTKKGSSFFDGLFGQVDKINLRLSSNQNIDGIREKVISQTQQHFTKVTSLADKIGRKMRRMARQSENYQEQPQIQHDEQLPEEEEQQQEEEQPKEVLKLDPKIFAVNMEFQQLKLSKGLIKAVHDIGYTHPTKIQAQMIPVILSGKDILASSCTGSGKTAAFLLPILERFGKTKREKYSKVLIVLPTRELALQCYEMYEKLNKYTSCTASLIIGAVPIQQQEAELRRHPDIIIATPGRMVDLLKNSFSIDLQNIEMLVFDEADRLLEMGFEAEVKEILKETPTDKQTVLISATLNATVKQLSKMALKKPIKLSVDFVGGLAYGLKQYLVRIRSNEEKQREACLLALLNSKFPNRTIIFVKTKHDCHRLAIILGFHSMNACELHGNLSQQQRIQAFEDFKEGKFNYLLATDLAARGLDIADVKAVVNFEIPYEVTRYIHRVGRTARIGAEGISVTLCLEDEVIKFKKMIRQSKQQLFRLQVDSSQIEHYREAIKELEPEIKNVVKEEVIEKELRKAEMLNQKAQNLIQYSDDIKRKPQKKWIQSKQQKIDRNRINQE